MPKRKGSRTQEEELNHLMRKVRKLERKIRKNKSDSDCDSTQSRSSTVRENSTLSIGDNAAVTPTPLVQAEDLLDPEYEITERSPIASEETPHIDGADISQAGPNTSTAVAQIENSLPVCDEPYLDTDILAILGDDPSSSVKYGPDIRKELACRLQHVATEGLSKECRKDLMNKYLIPANCVHIDAPKINPEIKAAIPENFVKRDIGIESKQKQMATAISGLGQLITTQLNSKDKNNETLQKLMDISRLLCDLQHADSVTRRNFILFGLKKDLKEHLTDTKIDSFLFSEHLAETLKSAKAVSKSGVELKADTSSKAVNKPKPTTNYLNRKAPPRSRRPLGTAPTAPRSRGPAAARAPPPPPPPPPAHSSRTSHAQQRAATYVGQARRRY